jgi:hypothetical protein
MLEAIKFRWNELSTSIAQRLMITMIRHCLYRNLGRHLSLLQRVRSATHIHHSPPTKFDFTSKLIFALLRSLLWYLPALPSPHSQYTTVRTTNTKHEQNTKGYGLFRCQIQIIKFCFESLHCSCTNFLQKKSMTRFPRVVLRV